MAKTAPDLLDLVQKCHSSTYWAKNAPAVSFWPQNALQTNGPLKTKRKKLKHDSDLLDLIKKALY